MGSIKKIKGYKVPRTATHSTREIEETFRPVARHILLKLESFGNIVDGPNYQGTPFDFLGKKDGQIYLIEMKASKSYFHLPKETQKIRLKEIRRKIPGLKIALLQINGSESAYKMLYNEDYEKLLRTKRASYDKIIEWIKERK